MNGVESKDLLPNDFQRGPYEHVQGILVVRLSARHVCFRVPFQGRAKRAGLDLPRFEKDISCVGGRFVTYLIHDNHRVRFSRYLAPRSRQVIVNQERLLYVRDQRAPGLSQDRGGLSLVPTIIVLRVKLGDVNHANNRGGVAVTAGRVLGDDVRGNTLGIIRVAIFFRGDAARAYLQVPFRRFDFRVHRLPICVCIATGVVHPEVMVPVNYFAVGHFGCFLRVE